MPSSRTVLVTGATSGLGLETARVLGSQGWRVQVTSREARRAQSVAADLNSQIGGDTATGLVLDLASQASIRQAAARIIASGEPLDAIVCNAGVSLSGPTQMTDDGVEKTFRINHLGHFLITALLAGHLRRPARIVFVSSGTHIPDHTIGRRTGTPAPVYTSARELALPVDPGGGMAAQSLRYTTSKLCNVLCANELARRVVDRGISTPQAEIDVFSIDPGLMPGTGLSREYPRALQLIATGVFSALRPFVDGIRTPAQSGRDVARLVSDPALMGRSGAYFDGPDEVDASPVAYERDTAQDLWDTSVGLTGLSREESAIA